MTKARTSLSLITLNINGLNSPIKRQIKTYFLKRQNKIMTQLYAAYKRKKKDSLESQHKWVESERVEKGSPCKQSPGVSGGGYTTRMEENICKSFI